MATPSTMYLPRATSACEAGSDFCSRLAPFCCALPAASSRSTSPTTNRHSSTTKINLGWPLQLSSLVIFLTYSWKYRPCDAPGKSGQSCTRGARRPGCPRLAIEQASLQCFREQSYPRMSSTAKANTALAAAVVFLLFSSCAAYFAFARLRTSQLWVEHTREVQRALDQFTANAGAGRLRGEFVD